ncbi:MAG: hypothetical protein A2289_03850 [Deltaproteobacteria bacterium RIFOXYA12_FULL_58_15]|nr:MAG: hypothetical protein A2289_03850 [Deltaproteobacteria bacterium RIFOXYA12_FULL_58_15]OGR08612.1 MAG: hypothetical protein A2341_00085 [Deltaproteobacteria bacterium RIFOXYB12_FULL_58_9]
MNQANVKELKMKIFIVILCAACVSAVWGCAQENKDPKPYQPELDLCADVVCRAMDRCHLPGLCDPQTGECSNPLASDFALCDDGNACTYGDRCQSGVCVGGDNVVCRATDACHDVGVCDPVTRCSNPAKADDSPCGDNNPCTTPDRCQDGVCTGSPVVCAEPGPCELPGLCNSATGLCSFGRKPEGTACELDNPNLCLIGRCSAGECNATAVVCAAADQCHVAGTCDPATGACSNPRKADGVGCEDGNPCTQDDECQAGLCEAGPAVTCLASDTCHDAGVCSPATGCSNPVKADSSSCDDGNLCTQLDQCSAGKCIGSNPTICSAIDPCHLAGTCEPTTGVCSNPPIENGVLCDDGNACTSRTACVGGHCQGGTPVRCSALDPCHIPGICDPTTGCSNPIAENGTACQDDNACTQDDQCLDGVCFGADVVCPALNECHEAGICDPETGCSHVHRPDNTPCDDLNGCRFNDVCQNGRCEGTVEVVCNEACLESPQRCDPGSGTCIGTPVEDGLPCSLNDLCISDTSCDGGRCVGRSPVVCTAFDDCYDVGFCDPANGQCTNPTPYAGSACDQDGGCFVVVTSEMGITWQNPEFESSDLAGNAHFWDYDGDGQLDILFAGISGLALYRGNGVDFSDRTVDSGLPVATPGAVTGAAIADYDNDGDSDVYLTSNVSNRLYQNQGDGTFVDVTDLVGLLNVSPTAAAAFGDYDRDGYLDLYVGNYLNANGTVAANELLHNNYGDTFTDVTGGSGLDTDGATLAVLWSDYNGDGEVDLFVCNDLGATLGSNLLFENQGTGTPRFVEVSGAVGFDQAHLCQGLTGSADFDGDAIVDYYVSTYGKNLLLKNDLSVLTDVATAVTWVEHDTCSDPASAVSSWGAVFFDGDNDCQMDLFVTNGHRSTAGTPNNALFPPNALLRQDGGIFADISLSSGVGDPRRGRDVALGDFDKDGDQDVLVLNLDGSPILYRNDSTSTNNSVSLLLRGRQSNVDGFGAKVSMVADACSATFEKENRRDTAAVHLGLGTNFLADEIVVTWPSAFEQHLLYVLQGEAIVVEPWFGVQNADLDTYLVDEGETVEVSLTVENKGSDSRTAFYRADVWLDRAFLFGSTAELVVVAGEDTEDVVLDLAIPDDICDAPMDVDVVVSVFDAGDGLNQMKVASALTIRPL